MTFGSQSLRTVTAPGETSADRATVVFRLTFDSIITRLLHLIALLFNLLSVLVALRVASSTDSSACHGTHCCTWGAMEGTTDDRAEYGAGDGSARHCAWRLRGAHDTNASPRWQTGRARIKSRLPHGPEMALVTIAVLLFRCLVPKRIRVDD